VDVTTDGVLHIGDDATLDALGALNAGMQAGWLNRSDAIWPHEQEPQATLTHLGELRELLA
jgi:putative hydrolase of the HAD superfamily